MAAPALILSEFKLPEIKLPTLKLGLALGFAFITQEVATQLQATQSSDLTNPYLRDRARLLALQKVEAPACVISANLDRPENECESLKHLQGDFTRSSFDQKLKNLLLKRHAHRSVKQTEEIVTIFCEYLRMPQIYMRLAFKPLLLGGFQRWKSEGLIQAETVIYTPNLVSLTEDDEEVKAALNRDFVVERITALQNPLFAASETVDPEIIGMCYSNNCSKHAEHIQQLHPEFPFLKIQCK